MNSSLLLRIILGMALLAHHTSSSSFFMAASGKTFPTNNPGDRHGLFLFAVPFRFRGRVLGPETYQWLVKRFGQSLVDREGIQRALSDDHSCGSTKWCRAECGARETRDWTRKDLCGAFHCCCCQSSRPPANNTAHRITE